MYTSSVEANVEANVEADVEADLAQRVVLVPAGDPNRYWQGTAMP